MAASYALVASCRASPTMAQRSSRVAAHRRAHRTPVSPLPAGHPVHPGSCAAEVVDRPSRSQHPRHIANAASPPHSEPAQPREISIAAERQAEAAIDAPGRVPLRMVLAWLAEAAL